MQFPPYSYVPGGPWPHPKSHPEGHAHHTIDEPADAMDPDRWCESEAYIEGILLFNEGFYWEAHEAWERLWHAAGRTGVEADFLKVLIKLAAAGVKLREGVMTGAATHAQRAESLCEAVMQRTGPRFAGQDLKAIIEHARAIRNNLAKVSEVRDDSAVKVVFDWKLRFN